jgi:hypothetical protein
MTSRRMTNRKGRRVANEDLRVMRIELQNASANERSQTCCTDAEAAQRFKELLSWTLELVSIGDENRASIIALRGDLERLKKTHNELLKVATTTTIGFDLDFRLNCLRSDVDSIIASVKAVRSASQHFSQDPPLPNPAGPIPGRRNGILYCESFNRLMDDESRTRSTFPAESTTETRS